MKDGWERRLLGDVCQVVNGGTPRTEIASYWGGSHAWITPAEMGKLPSPSVSLTARTLSDDGLANSSAKLIPPNSVILSTRAPIGHLVINEVPMAFNQGCRGLVPSAPLITKYLYYFLLHSTPVLEGLGTGATFKELSAGKLKGMTIPVPPLAEQERIVRILDDALTRVDVAIDLTEQVISSSKVFFETFAAERLSSPETTTPTTVEALAAPHRYSIRTGPFGSQLLHSEFVDEGVSVLGIDNAVANTFRWSQRRFITQEKYRGLRRYTVKPGDLLITIMGTVGRCAVVPYDIPTAITTKHLCCVTVDEGKCIPEFLHAYFLFHPVARSYLGRTSKGSIMDGLNMSIIKAMPIELPSIVEQARLVAQINAAQGLTDSMIASYTERGVLADELRNSLLHHAFTGQL